MREIIVFRNDDTKGDQIISIVLDGITAAKISCGETVKLAIDDNSHEIVIYSANGLGNVLKIASGDENIIFHVCENETNSKFDLIPESAENVQNMDKYVADNQSHIIQNNIAGTTQRQIDQTPTYAFGGVVSMILLLTSIIVFLERTATTIVGFVIACILSISSGAVIIIGGFWLVILPLPFITIWKSGCVKPYQSLGLKAIMLILSFVFPILVFVMLFGL